MITTSDIADILYIHLTELADCMVAREGFIPVGAIDDERVVVHPRALTKGTYWAEGVQEVNYLVPDTYDGYANLTRLAEIERLLLKNFKGNGEHDDTYYIYKPLQSQILSHDDLKAHYVNVKILFKTLNTME